MYGSKVECMEQKVIGEIENKLGYKFRDRRLLEQAFTHSSYANIKGVEDNERMEFFGDAILEYVSSEWLFAHFGDCDAGELSAMRSKVVSAEGLRPVIDKLDLLKYLAIAENSSKTILSSRKIEANLYEAILCAIYLDGGMKSAKAFAMRTLNGSLQKSGAVIAKDSKSALQEYCQRNKRSISYKIVDRRGPDDKPCFKCALYIDGVESAVGEGSSIKKAEQDAAGKIVVKWRIE